MRVAHEIADQRGIALGEHQRATETVCVCREARIRSGAKKSTESPRWGRGGLECPAVSIHNTFDEGTRERECKLAGRSNTTTPRPKTAQREGKKTRTKTQGRRRNSVRGEGGRHEATKGRRDEGWGRGEPFYAAAARTKLYYASMASSVARSRGQRRKRFSGSREPT